MNNADSNNVEAVALLTLKVAILHILYYWFEAQNFQMIDEYRFQTQDFHSIDQETYNIIVSEVQSCNSTEEIKEKWQNLCNGCLNFKIKGNIYCNDCTYIKLSQHFTFDYNFELAKFCSHVNFYYYCLALVNLYCFKNDDKLLDSYDLNSYRDWYYSENDRKLCKKGSNGLSDEVSVYQSFLKSLTTTTATEANVEFICIGIYMKFIVDDGIHVCVYCESALDNPVRERPKSLPESISELCQAQSDLLRSAISSVDARVDARRASFRISVPVEIEEAIPSTKVRDIIIFAVILTIGLTLCTTGALFSAKIFLKSIHLFTGIARFFLGITACTFGIALILIYYIVNQKNIKNLCNTDSSELDIQLTEPTDANASLDDGNIQQEQPNDAGTPRNSIILQRRQPNGASASRNSSGNRRSSTLRNSILVQRQPRQPNDASAFRDE
jgi:hypothetical protein